jgi:hypothetical protein
MAYIGRHIMNTSIRLILFVIVYVDLCGFIPAILDNLSQNVSNIYFYKIH